MRAAVDALGGLDVLVNNAGIGAQGTVEDNPDDEWRRVYEVNVLGAVRLSRACLPHLRESDAASIVNTCSIAATAGLPQRALYSATKGAVAALTRAMAADHIREGIRVNAVNPGTADTPGWRDCCRRRRTLRRNGPPWRRANRTDASSPPTRSPRPSRTSRVPSPGRRRASTSRSTAGCRHSGSVRPDGARRRGYRRLVRSRPRAAEQEVVTWRR